MSYVSCPNCYARFQVPDGAAQGVVRCPKCRHAFVAAAGAEAGSARVGPGVGTAAAGTGSAAGGARGAQAGVGAGHAASEEAGKRQGFGFGAGEGPSRMMSAADEAMLRELGSGTGLLDMTRGVFESIADAPGGREAATHEETISDRQFQIVGTALTMANKLTEVYKGELARARRLSWLAWGSTLVFLVAGVGATAYAVMQSSSAMVQRSQATSSSEKVADLKGMYEEEKTRAGAMGQELQGVRDDLREAQRELTGARESMNQNQATIERLTGDLRAVKDRAVELQRQVDVVRVAASQPGAEAVGTQAVRN